jgi:hypothetical protein
MCANETLFRKTSSEPDMDPRPWFADSSCKETWNFRTRNGMGTGDMKKRKRKQKF